MQMFVEKEVRELIEDGTIKREKIRVLCQHSDNGACVCMVLCLLGHNAECLVRTILSVAWYRGMA